MLRPGFFHAGVKLYRSAGDGASEANRSNLVGISHYGLELGWGCSSHLTPIYLTSSLLSGELSSYDAEPEGVNEGFSLMKLRSIAVLPSSPDTDLKLFKVREQSLVRTDALGEGRQTLISHRAGRRAPHFHRNLNPGVLDEAGPLIRQPVSGKENPSMPVYHSKVWVGEFALSHVGSGRLLHWLSLLLRFKLEGHRRLRP